MDMADQRIIDYLCQNMGNYPMETLKAACIKNGFSAAAVEEATQTVLAQGAPPPPTAPPAIGPGTSSADSAAAGDYIDLNLKNMFANALLMAKHPETYFSRIDPNGGFANPISMIVLWSLFSAPLAGAVAFIKSGLWSVGLMSVIGGMIMLPIMAIILSFIGAGIYHVLCQFLGGTSSFRGSYGVVASMSALMPASTLLGLVPYAGVVIPQLASLYLMVMAAAALHRIAKKKAWLVFGGLTAFWLLLSLSVTIAAKRLKVSLDNLSVQTMTQVGGPPNLGGGNPGAMSPDRGLTRGSAASEAARAAEQAMATASAMMKALGDEQQTDEFQQAMSRAQNNPMAVLKDLQKYQNMAYPPKEILLLLDSKTSSMLVEEWPNLSGPIRQSIVQSLPTIPAKDRSESLQEMLEATRGVNKMLGESMKMLNDVLPQGQEEP